MSGECEKCGEHALDCQCLCDKCSEFDEFIKRCPFDLGINLTCDHKTVKSFDPDII